MSAHHVPTVLNATNKKFDTFQDFSEWHNGNDDGWLVVRVLWHINLCGLFNAKSIFMKTVLFQTISTQFKCKYSLIVKNIFISS